MLQECVIAITIVIILAIFIKKTHDVFVDDRVAVKAPDGRTYRVRNTPQKEETASALARLNTKTVDFVERLHAEAPIEYKTMAARLRKRYNPETLSEGRIDKRFTSYTVNKGEEVVLCLRTRDHKDHLYDDNLIFYVTLHELAHISSISEDHSEEFHRNFRYLLRKASEWNMFRRITKKFNYCGMDVNGT